MAGPCPFCQGPLAESPRWIAYDHLRLAPGPQAFHSCGNCRSVALQPIPSAKSLLKFYPDRYLFKAEEGPKASRLLRSLENNIFYRWMYLQGTRILTRLKLARGSRLLDVGTGEGQLATVMRNMGFDVEGLEISKAAARSTRERLHMTVYDVPIEEHALVAPARYDVLTMFDVLEHFHDMSATLSAVRALLREEGWLVLRVPLCDGFSMGLLGSRHCCLREAARHVALPSRRGLEILLDRNGFDVLHSQPSPLILRAGLIGLSLVPAGIYAGAVQRSLSGYFIVRLLAFLVTAFFGYPIALLESALCRPASVTLAARVKPRHAGRGRISRRNPAMATESTQPRPNFLYIGTTRSGSSWIYEILREHPEAFMPKVKDLHFFDDYYHKGLEWYLGFFRNAGSAKAIGEIDHDYFLSEQTAMRIHECLPDARLFCCLREPVERTLSAFLFNRTTHISKEMTFEEYAFRSEALKENDYYSNLLPFYRLFPKERILALFYDELRQDPGEFARRIYSFLGIDRTFIPTSLHRVVLPSRASRFYRLSQLGFRLTWVLRDMGLPGAVGRLKRNPLLERLLFKTITKKPEIPPDVASRLRAMFSKDYDALSNLIGREVPPSWRSTANAHAP